MPPLPRGEVVFESLPMAAVVVEALGPAVRAGVVIAHAPGRAGLVLIRDGEVIDAFTFEPQPNLRGHPAVQRLQQWQDASVSAHRLDPTVLDALPVIVSGSVCYDDLQLEWIDWTRFIDDLRRRAGVHVVEVRTPSGGGVVVIRDGVDLLAYSDAATGSVSLLDEIVAGGEGSLRVRRTAAQHDSGLDGAMMEIFGRAQPALGPHQLVPQPPAGAPSLERLAPQLKTLAHRRLQRSSGRVEQLIHDSLGSGASLEALAERVEATPIRGIVPDRMRALADEMRALAAPAAGDQSFLPA